MSRLFALITGAILSMFLVTAVYAATDSESGNRKPKPKGNSSVRAYHEKQKQRMENKKRGQQTRQQQISRGSGARNPQSAQ